MIYLDNISNESFAIYEQNMFVTVTMSIDTLHI